jgi:hypothetical protein
MGAGPSGLLSAQFLSRQKYHVSLGEFVLSVSHNKRKKEDAVAALSNLFVESLSKTLTSQIWVRDYLSRILHHGTMSPALVADQPQGLIQKGVTSSRPRKYILARIIFLVLMASALAYASTRYHYEEAVQSLRERGCITVALESSSSSTPFVQEKETNETQEERASINPAAVPGDPTEVPRPIIAARAYWSPSSVVFLPFVLHVGNGG